MRTAIPEWTLADRLRKARNYARLEQVALAAALDVTPSMISRWENGAPIKRPFVSAWALRCGVPFEWLMHGTVPPDQGSHLTAWLMGADSAAPDTDRAKAEGNTAIVRNEDLTARIHVCNLSSMEAGPPDELLTTAEVARLARVSVGAVSKWAVSGELPVAVQTPGGRRRFWRSDVERILFPVAVTDDERAS